MSMDRPDLAAAFTSRKAPVDRAAGLTGLLPPPPKPRPSTSPSTTSPGSDQREDQPAATHDAAPAAAPARPAVRKDSGRAVRTITPAAAPASESADTVANVAVYLEPDLLDQAREHRRSRQITYDELVVDAFAAVPDHALQQALSPQRAASPITGMPARQRRVRGTAGIQIQLRLTGLQRTWLDAKQQAVGAPSRSALVATALKLYLLD